MRKTRKLPLAGAAPIAPKPKRTSRPAPTAADRQRQAATFRLLFDSAKKTKAFWIVIGGSVLLVAAVVLLFVYTELDWSQVTKAIDGLNPIAVLPLMALLPVLGFPVAVVYLVAGARFGPVWGGVVVAGVTAVHLLLTHLIANSFLRKPLERFIEKRHFKLPEIPADEQPAIALIAALAPGLPYVVRNYLLALAGVKLRFLLWVCLPVYTARSYVTILLGDLGAEPSRRRLLILLAVDFCKVLICAGVIWWLRRHHRKYHAHADDASPQPSGAAK